VKDKVLQKLKENTSSFISGEELSGMLDVSRTAVWKHIKSLKEDGYIIESSSRKGYRLLPSPDIINVFEIKQGLKTVVIGKKIIYLDTVDSTNNYAKIIAAQGCADGTVVITDTQTSGRGRLGRTWNSADRAGIWMSVVLKPDIPPEDVQLITLAASVAVVSAIKEVTGLEVGIKWPNDVILGGKKACGILTEMNSEMERVNFIVLGIGINVKHTMEDFPEELRNVATSIKAFADGKGIEIKWFERNDLIRVLLCELERLYTDIINGDVKGIVERWKKHSVTLGREVKIFSRNCEYRGMAVDVTQDGKLVVDCTDGITRKVASGEISIRGILGYT
jgi:BirA family biotin operon repressor/biotin-[acetyl-CoA-carboxylase] ligase